MTRRLSRPGWHLLATALGLTIIAAAVYGPNAVQGGFLSDAWSIRAIYAFAPGGGFTQGVSAFLEQTAVAARPLFAVYLASLNAVFGSHMGLWLAWLVASNVLMSLCLYLLLRKLSFGFLDASLIAALVLIFPAATSLKLWAAVAQAPVAISFALLGFLLALSGFDTEGRRRIAFHFASLLLFAASLLLYEVALPLMLSSVLLYRVRVSWRAAAKRWLADCAVLVPLALVLTLSTSAHSEGAGSIWNHGVTILDQARVLLATVVLPLKSAHWYQLLLIALVPITSLLVLRLLAEEDAARPELRRWLLTMAAGICVVAFGYAVFVPAVDYYIPLGAGIADRVNAVPALGWVLILYSGIRLVATLAFRGLAAGHALVPAFALLSCTLIAAGWLRSDASQADAYRRAFAENERVLATIQAAIPEPAAKSTIWTFGQPVEIAPGVPVFGNTWDMTGSVQLTYGDSELTSYVAFPDTTFECRAGAVVPGGNPTYETTDSSHPSPFSSRYRRTYFIDTTTGRWATIHSPAQCRRAVRSFPRSPPLPPP